MLGMFGMTATKDGESSSTKLMGVTIYRFIWEIGRKILRAAFLLGTAVSDKVACFVSGSGTAMKRLQDLYFSPNKTRAIRVTIVNH
jgi:hypothetical protein